MPDQVPLQLGNTRLDRLHLALESGALLQAGKMLNALHPGEIAHLLESLPMAQREMIWELVNEENGGEVLTLLADEVREDRISQMDV